MDGPENIHDEFRNVKGSYRKTTKFIRKLLDIGCDVRINTAVGNHNIHYMKNFMSFIRDEFRILHRLVTVDPIGRAENQQGLMVTNENFAELLSEYSENFQFLDSHDVSSAHDWRTPACGIGNAMLFIDAYGNVSLWSDINPRTEFRFFSRQYTDSIAPKNLGNDFRVQQIQNNPM